MLANFEDRPIELYQGAMDNPQAEAVYTGEVWLSVAEHVLTVRSSPSVRFVKDAYVIGNGLAFDDDEKASLGEPVPLLELDGPDGTTWETDTFHCSRSEIAQSLQEGVDIAVPWPRTDEEFERFLRQCAQLFRVVPNPQLVAFFSLDRSDFTIRNLQAVRIALGNHRIFGDVDDTLGQINHHGAAPISSLRNIGTNSWGPNRSEKSNRLVLCWMELGIMADTLQWLANLQDGPPEVAANVEAAGSPEARHASVDTANIAGGTSRPRDETAATTEGGVTRRAGTPPLPNRAHIAPTPRRLPRFRGHSSSRPASSHE